MEQRSSEKMRPILFLGFVILLASTVVADGGGGPNPAAVSSIQQISICGNDVCDASKGEDVISCIEDCHTSSISDWSWRNYVVVGLFTLAGIIIIYTRDNHHLYSLRKN